MVNAILVNTTRKATSVDEPNINTKVFDVCIIGSGVVGTALSLYLANHNISVVLIENDFTEQKRIVGELLQPDGYRQLQSMGLAEVLEEIDAVTIYGYALLLDNSSMQVKYPEKCFGKGMQNGKFVQALRNKTFKHKNIRTIEGKATKLNERGNAIKGVAIQLKSNKEIINIKAKLTIAADGFFSSFRKDLHAEKPENTGFFVGLILKDIQLPYYNCGHVFMNHKAPILCYPIAPNTYRILVDFEPQHIPKKGKELNDYLLNNIKPVLPKNMHLAFEKAVYSGHIKSMSNHRLSSKTKYMKGAAILGDALNMRHPLTGGGMTVGLTDAKKIGDIIIQHHQTINYHDKLKAFYINGRTHNASINILADALYGVVKDHQLSVACYNYLSKGGKCESVPVSLLAGVNRNKKELIYHFFKVAFYGAYQNFIKEKNIKGMRSSFKMIKNAFNLVLPLLEAEQPYIWEKIILFIGKKIF